MLDQLGELVEEKYGTGAYLTLHKGSWSIRANSGDIILYGMNFDRLNEQLHTQTMRENYSGKSREVSPFFVPHPEESYSLCGPKS